MSYKTLVLEDLTWLIILIAAMWVIAYLVDSMKSESNQTLSQYECGFEAIIWKKLSPSLHFSKIGLVFITFDLEMLLIISLMNSSKWLPISLALLMVWGTLWLEMELKSLSWGN